MRQALNAALAEALAADPDVILLGEDLADPAGGISQITKGLSTTFGTDRVRDTPISEAAIVGAAVGAAIAGLRPVAELMIMDFISIGLDQLVNHAAKARFMSGGLLRVPLTLRTAVFGGIGSGATHSQTLEAWLAHVPGLKVVVPATPADAKGLLTSCIFDDDPCVFVENVALYGTRGPVPEGEPPGPPGRGRRRPARSGRDPRDLRTDGARRIWPPPNSWPPRASRWRWSTSAAWCPSTPTPCWPRPAAPVGSWWPTTPRASPGSGPRWPPWSARSCSTPWRPPSAASGRRFAPIGSAATLEAAVMPSVASLVDAVRSVTGA